MKDYTFLYNILNTNTPSGLECRGNKVFEDYVSNFATKHLTDKVGNTIYKVGSGATKILISAHIDEIGLRVQFIDNDGFIHVIKNGGADLKSWGGTKTGSWSARTSVSTILCPTARRRLWHASTSIPQVLPTLRVTAHSRTCKPHRRATSIRTVSSM